MLKHLLESETNFDHNRQWFNTFIPPLHETAAVTVDCISRLSGLVRLILRYTTVDIHCRNSRYEWDGGIKMVSSLSERSAVRLVCRIATAYVSPHFWVETILMCGSNIFRSVVSTGCGLSNEKMSKLWKSSQWQNKHVRFCFQAKLPSRQH